MSHKWKQFYLIILTCAFGLLSFCILLPTKAMAATEYDHYLFAYFKSPQYPNSQQLYFAVSSDGLHYQEVNHGQPVVKVPSEIRDPYLIRRAGGLGFNILATSHDPSGKTDPNRSIMNLYSSDLVNWAYIYRNLGTADAAYTWAPEAIWDPQQRNYLVIWAQPQVPASDENMTVFAAHTTDFVNFTDSKPYSSDNHNDVIDPTVFQAGNQYVRFFKDEASKKVFSDAIVSVDSDQSTPIQSNVLNSINNVEGPQVYQLYGQNEWVLLLDHYDKDGYEPLITNNLYSGDFTTPPSASLPAGARHGSVLPITTEEYQRILNKWQS